MIAAAIFMGIGAFALAWLSWDLFRHHQSLRRWEREYRRRERMQERAAQSNGHPRTGNVDHITYR